MREAEVMWHRVEGCVTCYQGPGPQFLPRRSQVRLMEVKMNQAKLLLLCCTEERLRASAHWPSEIYCHPHFTYRETGTKKRRESRDSASLATVLWPVPTEAQEPFQSGPGPTWRLSLIGPRPPEDLLAPQTPDSNPRDKQPSLGASAPSSIHQTTICLLSKSSTCHLSFLPQAWSPYTHTGA